MKHLILCLTLCTALHSIAQTKSVPPPAIEDRLTDGTLASRQPAKLIVKVKNNHRKPGSVMIKYSIVHPGSETQQSNNTSLDLNNEAIIILDENLPYQQVWLSVDSLYYAGLLVNNDLEVTIDDAVINEEVYLAGPGVTLKGLDAPLNNQLIQHLLYKKNQRLELEGRFAQSGIDAANKKIVATAFLKIVDSVYTALQQIDKQYLQAHPGYEWAIRNQTDSYLYEWLLIGFFNYDMPSEWWTKAQQHKAYFTSNEGNGYYRSLSRFLNSKGYPKYAAKSKALFEKTDGYPAEKIAILDSVKLFERSMEAINSGLLSRIRARRDVLFKKELQTMEMEQSMANIQEAYSGGKADMLRLFLMERWKDEFAFAYPVILANLQSNWSKNYLQSKLDNAREQQSQIESIFSNAAVQDNKDGNYIGKALATLPFDATLYKLDTISTVENFIRDLRAKFNNKVLLLDIWATWCAPCLSDIPNSMSLHKENADLPIEYVYLCTTSGSTEEIWKKRIATLKAPGTHIFVDDAILNALRKLLRAEGGYPTYVVIDRDGKVNSKAISFLGGMDRAALKIATGIN